MWQRVAALAGECDSTDTLHLTVHYSGTGFESATACDSYMWKGVARTQGGTYVFDTLTTAGCDSTVTLALTVNASAGISRTAVACGGYVWHDSTLSQSGTYVFDTLTAAGCDSTVTLHLTVNQPVLSAVTESVCDGYTWFDSLYTVSGDYLKVRTAVVGECDSTDTLHLTVHYSGTGSETASACDGYTWNGSTYTHTGSYSFDTLTTAGCDSVVTLSLTVTHPVYISDSVMICEGGFFYWVRNGNVYMGDTSDIFVLQGHAGECDTTVTLELMSVHPPHIVYIDSACDSYTWIDNGVTYTSTGRYIYTHPDSVYGCTQVDTLYLTVYHSATVYDTIVVSGSELPYDYHGESISAEGDYSFLGITSEGCDSNVYLSVTVNYEGIDDVRLNAIKLYQRDGCIVVEGIEGMAVRVFDALGRMLGASAVSSLHREDACTGQTYVFVVPTTGVYMVSIDNLPVRCIVVVK